MTGPRFHVLKVIPPYYDDIRRGRKTFEVRRNDRAYQVGDVLVLREWHAQPVPPPAGVTDAVTGCSSCREAALAPTPFAPHMADRPDMHVSVVYVASYDPRLPPGIIAPGTVVLGISYAGPWVEVR